MEDSDTSSDDASVQLFRKKVKQQSPIQKVNKKRKHQESESDKKRKHQESESDKKLIKRDIEERFSLKKKKISDDFKSKVKSKTLSKQRKRGDFIKMTEKSSCTESDSDNDSQEEGEDNSKEKVRAEDQITDEENSEEEEEEEKEDKEYTAIKEELSQMSFEELQKLKEKLGLKVFNQVLHSNRYGSQNTKRVFKRENKNRPMEMSSKRPVSRFREISTVKKKINRDPRFDDLSGEYNEHYFKKSYSFLDDVKKKEMEKVHKKLKKESNAERKHDLQYLYNRMKQQQMAAEQKQKREDIEKEWKKIQQEKVQEGKRPVYLKKSDKRKLELAEKYKDLKKSGKVDKYLTKKRKKNAQKEKKKLPLHTF